MATKKRSKKQKENLVELNEHHYITGLDFSYWFGATFYEMCQNLEIVKQDPEIAKAVDKAADSIFDLYQLIGKKAL